MASFHFDPNLPPHDNVERFLLHMESLDAEMGALLRKHLHGLLPIPEVQSHRTEKRRRINEAIAKALDSNP